MGLIYRGSGLLFPGGPARGKLGGTKWGSGGGGGGGAVALTYGFHMDFVGDDQGYANAQVLDTDAEGQVVGSWTVMELDSSVVALSSNTCTITGPATSGHAEAGGYSNGLSRVTGQGFYAQSSVDTINESVTSSLAGSTSVGYPDYDCNMNRSLSGEWSLHWERTGAGSFGTISDGGIPVTLDTMHGYVAVIGGYNSSGEPYISGDTAADYNYGYAHYIEDPDTGSYELFYRTKEHNTATLYNGFYMYSAGASATVNALKGTSDGPFASLLEAYIADRFAGAAGTALSAHTPDVDPSAGGWTDDGDGADRFELDGSGGMQRDGLTDGTHVWSTISANNLTDMMVEFQAKTEFSNVGNAMQRYLFFIAANGDYVYLVLSGLTGLHDGYIKLVWDVNGSSGSSTEVSMPSLRTDGDPIRVALIKRGNDFIGIVESPTEVKSATTYQELDDSDLSIRVQAYAKNQFSLIPHYPVTNFAVHELGTTSDWLTYLTETFTADDDTDVNGYNGWAALPRYNSDQTPEFYISSGTLKCQSGKEGLIYRDVERRNVSMTVEVDPGSGTTFMGGLMFRMKEYVGASDWQTHTRLEVFSSDAVSYQAIRIVEQWGKNNGESTNRAADTTGSTISAGSTLAGKIKSNRATGEISATNHYVTYKGIVTNPTSTLHGIYIDTDNAGSWSMDNLVIKKGVKSTKNLLLESFDT